MTFYFVTRGEGTNFVAILTLDEIRIQLAAEELQADWYATESDGRSFKQFRSSGEGRWRTLEKLLSEQPTLATPVTIPVDAPAHGRLLDEYQGGSVSSFVLGVGLMTAALGCVVTPIVLFFQAFWSGQVLPVRENCFSSCSLRAGVCASTPRYSSSLNGA